MANHTIKAAVIRFGTRIFIVKDDDTLQRMPINRFNRLFRQDPEERFSEYAGKRVRYALFVIDLKKSETGGHPDLMGGGK